MFVRNLQRARLLRLARSVQLHIERGGSIAAFVKQTNTSRARVYRALNYAIRIDGNPVECDPLLDMPVYDPTKRDRRHTDPKPTVKPIDPLLD